jgi:putative component of toxin-antitoxin plasmid stabilization module
MTKTSSGGNPLETDIGSGSRVYHLQDRTMGTFLCSEVETEQTLSLERYRHSAQKDSYQ